MSLLDDIEKGDLAPLRVFVLVAHYDLEFREDGNALARALRERGYETGFLEIPEGHSWNAWKSHIDDVLEFLFPGEGRMG